MTFGERENQTTLAQKHYLLEKKYVEKAIDELAHAKVAQDHVPRVATLAPGYRLQELIKSDREASAQRSLQHSPQVPQHGASISPGGEREESRYSHSTFLRQSQSSSQMNAPDLHISRSSMTPPRERMCSMMTLTLLALPIMPI